MLTGARGGVAAGAFELPEDELELLPEDEDAPADARRASGSSGGHARSPFAELPVNEGGARGAERALEGQTHPSDECTATVHRATTSHRRR